MVDITIIGVCEDIDMPRVGTVNTTRKDYREALEKHAGTAILTLIDVCKRSADDRCRIAAATAILDRCYGRPRQQLQVSHNKPLDTEAIMAALADTARGVMIDTDENGDTRMVVTPAKTLPDNNVVDVTPREELGH